ncbi:MAG: ATP-binding cassette domain-containing protein [Candidatus Hermodarchaeota archaeon]
MSEFVIETKDLHMTYGKRKSIVKALRGVDFRIKSGENYCLLGPNGAGKTTLIRSILGLLEAEGSIKVLDYEMPKDRNKIITHIGYMPQELSLYPDLSVKETMHFFGRIYGLKNQERHDSVNALLDFFLLKQWKNTRVENLSGGMKRRLSLASTLVHNPKLLILDEPTIGVDPKLRITFWDYFKELNEQGVTIITTTHVMDEAEKSRLIGFMREGKLIAEGTYQDLRKNVPGQRKLVIETDLEDTNRLAKVIQAKLECHIRSQGFKLEIFYDDDSIIDEVLVIVRKNAVIRSVQTVLPSLEDTFIFFSKDKKLEAMI